MGNCLFGGVGEEDEVIKVVRSNGGIMEFYGPITAECITNEFPGHGLFPSHDLFWKPLPYYEELHAGNSYYLLPLNAFSKGGHIRSKSVPSSLIPPYRTSFDHDKGVLKRSYTEVMSKHANNCGIWKVKLVISPEQLMEILSKEAHTQELIESVTTVAKCRNGLSSVCFSDQWSLSSSKNSMEC